jgi:hypothetical protein
MLPEAEYAMDGSVEKLRHTPQKELPGDPRTWAWTYICTLSRPYSFCSEKLI